MRTTLIGFLILFTLVLMVGATNVPAQESVEADQPAVADTETIVHDHETAEVAGEEAAPPPEPQMPGVADFLFSGKYLAFLILALAGLSLLLGRWVNYWVRLGMLLVAFALFGLDYIYPLHPSPMCAVTKLFMFKFTHGQFFAAFIAMFLAIFIPSLVGQKLFCGWVCPLGAFQDLVNKIPFKWRWKRFNFTAFNALRMGLLVMFFLTFFLIMDQMAMLAQNVGADASEPTWKIFSAFSLYESINFFELLHWTWTTRFTVMFVILVIASLALYRPFCYAICPIGALTWLCEKIAPGKIRVNHDTCTKCYECVEASPCPTIERIVEDDVKATPDCTSCGECLKVCPEDSITFGFKKVNG